MSMDDRDRLVGHIEEFGRHLQALRFSPLARGGFLADLTLTLPQLKALAVIAGAGATGRSGRELASLLGVGPSAITPLVDRLVEQGFASRQEDPIDRRILRVRATPNGVQMLERMASVHREVLAEIVQRIDAADLPALERALEILTDAAQRLANEQRVYA
jgi:DNA-binding MarR family transcriptional regulator